MSKILQVSEPFFNFEVGDNLTLTDDGKAYVYNVSEDYNNNNDSEASYSASFTISANYAKQLVKDGVLTEVLANTEEFKNVFTEIDTLLEQYMKEFNNLEVYFKDKPSCMKVEKYAVLSHLIKVLTHLRKLKK